MPSDMLSLEGVSFSYGEGLALRGVSLRVGPGEMVACIGPNGSGKTTLLKVACGVLRPGEGRVLLDGRDLRSLRRGQIAQQVAVVPQFFHMPFAFTVAEIVLLGRIPYLRPLAGPGPGDLRAVEAALAQVGLPDLSGRPFSDLSGGEKQKAILALALAQEPRVLLLDEPTAHLDIHHQVEALALVRRLHRERGLTVVAALHDLNLAALFFPRLALMKGGQVVADGSPEEVLTPEAIAEVFGARVMVGKHPSGAPHVLPLL